jgi:hypothetical protein
MLKVDERTLGLSQHGTEEKLSSSPRLIIGHAGDPLAKTNVVTVSLLR